MSAKGVITVGYTKLMAYTEAIGIGYSFTAKDWQTTMDEGFEILDHPADMGFRAWSGSIERLYATSALALTSVLTDIENIHMLEELHIQLTAPDRESLMFSWLSEILYQFDGERKLFRAFDISIKSTTDTLSLAAILHGESFNDERHSINTYVKAITFHQMLIAETDSSCTAQVFIDI